MKIALSGASGLVGQAVQDADTSKQHTFFKLVRRQARAENEITWDPETSTCDTDALEGMDAIIHLAGENVADGLWTKAKKKRIYESRVFGTELLASAIEQLKNPPSVFLSASAIGFYGHRPGETLTEEASSGEGFLSDVCIDWEQEALRVADAGIRTVILRVGLVLSARGGAFAKMKLPFSLGLGGQLGRGSQHWSWISLVDLVRAIYFCLEQDIEGPVNGVSPGAVSNKEFTKTLGSALKRPTILPVPTALLKLALRNFADEALLADTYCVPEKLLEAGFNFQDEDLQTLFQKLLENQEQFSL